MKQDFPERTIITEEQHNLEDSKKNNFVLDVITKMWLSMVGNMPRTKLLKQNTDVMYAKNTYVLNAFLKSMMQYWKSNNGMFMQLTCS